MPKKKTASKISSENASKHWDLIRRLAKETRLTVSQVRSAWSMTIRPWIDEIVDNGGPDYRVTPLTSARKLELQGLVVPPNEWVFEPVDGPALTEKPEPLTHTIQVTVKGDPGQLINVLLCMSSVTNVTIDKR